MTFQVTNALKYVFNYKTKYALGEGLFQCDKVSFLSRREEFNDERVNERWRKPV